MDTLFDKFFSPIKHSEKSLSRKLTGSQALARNSFGLFQNLPIEYQQGLLEDSLFATDFKNTPPSKTFKLNIHDLFSTFNHSMLHHIPKMTPCPDLLQEYRRLLNNPYSLDTVLDSVSDFSAILELMSPKTMEKHGDAEIARKSSISDQLVVSVADASSPHKNAHFNVTSSISNQLVVSIAETYLPSIKDSDAIARKDSISDQLVVSVADASSPNNKKKFSVTVSRAVQKSLPAPKDDCAFNQQMTTRKNKELQKRSKKRRRRQKKSSSNSTSNNVQYQKVQANCDVNHKSPIPPSKSSNRKDCDILCDMTVSANSASVQVVLPDLSSFVVTIEGSDDDSDWDTACDANWLGDDSEFQVSGLFVASFSATGACFPVVKPEEENLPCQELELIKARLNRVNRIWNETTVCLKEKQKSPVKVSFAPDEELEEICPVEMYERKGEWEIYATERLRFKKRIAEVGDILKPCLLPDHRAKVYSTLYEKVL